MKKICKYCKHYDKGMSFNQYQFCNGHSAINFVTGDNVLADCYDHNSKGECEKFEIGSYKCKDCWHEINYTINMTNGSFICPNCKIVISLLPFEGYIINEKL